ncbi:hypothetical protein KFL_002010135 [Klebsormidium nitens]|uniref:Uncharacterized protein n=1 Tax=Klebsormidium nitens TaxID=105231 RepID=A0A0U9HKD0_KLENI|nr:hypothetical protein KFL_002010135 [Klebsormidium nitens]|eukprot:GAQ84697.1 hypothetical protein KFL_002010135 [Klebsormidium nitens]
MWYAVRKHPGAFDSPGVAAASHRDARFWLGVWYRSLTAALRLISSLSMEVSNHAWLLEQGALQAVKQILLFLPADRMRSGHQEAALFIYRLFENDRVHRSISQSPVLTGLSREIVAQLVSIDGDLFGEGWGERIGIPLYRQLFLTAEDLFLAFLLGSEAWPIPMLLVYKVLSMLDLQVDQNILHVVDWYLYGQAVATLLFALCWLRMALLLVFIVPFSRFVKGKLWRVVIGAVGFFYLGNTGERTSFMTKWIALGLQHKGRFDPALLGTLLVRLCACRIKKAKPVLTPLAISAWVCSVLHLFAKGYISTGIWGDRQLRLAGEFLWTSLTFARLYSITMGTVIDLACVWPNGRTWIAERVEQEKRKVAENHLDCYVRADRTGQAPCFEHKADDTADLEFLCSVRVPLELFPTHSIKEALIAAALGGEVISGTPINKETAVEALAHLSFLKSLDLKSSERSCLARQLVKQCRGTVEKRHVAAAKTVNVDELKVGLEGLANLARDDPVIGSLLKSERLFSILARIADPPAPLAASLLKEAGKEVQDFEEIFEKSDTGYAERDLPKRRQELRESTDWRPARNQIQTRMIHLAELPSEFQRRSTVNFIRDSEISARLALLLTWHTFCNKHVAFQPPGHAATSYCDPRFWLGVWYRLLTAALRLISSLSTESSNHEWLLEQGALQAVKQSLQFLPADRMRSGHQEAALFVYRLFENRAVHRIISGSSLFTGLLCEIVAKLVSSTAIFSAKVGGSG